MGRAGEISKNLEQEIHLWFSGGSLLYGGGGGVYQFN
jgi:hypothetical protein